MLQLSCSESVSFSDHRDDVDHGLDSLHDDPLALIDPWTRNEEDAAVNSAIFSVFVDVLSPGEDGVFVEGIKDCFFKEVQVVLHVDLMEARNVYERDINLMMLLCFTVLISLHLFSPFSNPRRYLIFFVTKTVNKTCLANSAASHQHDVQFYLHSNRSTLFP